MFEMIISALIAAKPFLLILAAWMAVALPVALLIAKSMKGGE